ncbi:hypothetical protein BN59_02267 [Legionella massiliensis]|uniref:Uncharacterized protein n=1 Tax=Legionella massiliensis TaxID=1034943 RepID=A0A078KYH1_9GAMM|nr:hypothetical protein [Legionella massiliensis]CDZ77971.1 hypothetical protein BN59_02267 [Legionella massiliensis]CEE13709.1 hypothetical protein BN1094_02267 [Legionella massiliensis]
MKYIIEEVHYYHSPGQKPTFSIRWNTGTTDYYNWSTFPENPDLKNYKPWYYRNATGITMFRAPPEWPKRHIQTLNIRNYKADPEVPSSPSVVERLEKAADEICQATDDHCVYY